MAPGSRTAQAEGVGKPSSGQRLFNVILVLRWGALAVASVGFIRNLGTSALDFGAYIPVVSALTLYTAALSLFSDDFYRLHVRGPVLLVIDYAVSFAALALTGGVWSPFLAFALGSLLFAGLRGRVRAGVWAALAMTVVYVLALFVNGVTPAALASSSDLRLAVLYILGFWVLSIAWSYAAGLVTGLGDAYAAATEGRDRLARANAELDRRGKELLGLERLRRTLLEKPDLDQLLGGVLDALAYMGHDDARVWLCEGGRVRPFDQAGATMADSARFEDSVRRAVLESVPVPLDDDRTSGSGGVVAGSTSGGVVVPIVCGAEALGALEVHASVTASLTDEETTFLTMFADQVALAARNIKLAEEAGEWAMAEERDRIAVQLHDTVVGRLEAASALAASSSAEGLPPRSAAKLGRAASALTAALQDLKVAVLNWRSLEWGSGGVDLARRYVSEFTEMFAIPVRFESHGAETRLAPGRVKDLLRILQEALSNVVRHAGAHSVVVDLDFSPSGVTLLVRDDGRGYDPADVSRRAGIGLRAIRRRGRRHGGKVSLTSVVGQGSEVRVWLPC